MQLINNAVQKGSNKNLCLVKLLSNFFLTLKLAA